MCNTALKLHQYFYLLMKQEASWCRYFQVWSPYYQAAQCDQKTPITRSSLIKPKNNGLSQKKSKQMGLRTYIYIFEKSLEFLGLPLYPWKFQTK